MCSLPRKDLDLAEIVLGSREVCLPAFTLGLPMLPACSKTLKLSICDAFRPPGMQEEHDIQSALKRWAAGVVSYTYIALTCTSAPLSFGGEVHLIEA